MTLVLVSFVIIFSGFQLASCRISCRDQNDRAVDWFLIYKLPDINKHWDSAVQKGMGFLYLDENSKEFYLSKVNINSSSQSLAYTLQQLYDTKSQEDVYHVMYNDDHPGSKKDSYRGHTKGVQLFDMDTGYWLIHSVPEFPLQTKYSYPTSGTVYGQSFICITFNRFQLREIAEQLALYQPSIYSSQLPDRLAELYPKLSEIIAKKSIRKPPFNRRSEIMSRGGTLFTSFAKHKKWNLDLYADFVAPSLEQTFYVETWLNGQGDLPSRCNSSYKVYNLRSVIPFGVDFPNSKDHSKWAVAHDQDSPWICIGDINRQSSQYNRAGGTMCLKDKSVWLNYRQAAQKAESSDYCVIMPSCPAIDCNNGFDDGPLPLGITFHRFPRNEQRRKFRVQQLHRDDGFTATENSRICSAHFAPEDYKYDQMAQRRLLKDGAYPHIFAGRAKHLTKESPASRPPTATASARLHADNQRWQEQMEAFEQDDAINTTEQIVEKLKVERIPDGFVTLEQENCVILCRICTEQPQLPQLLGSITVANDLRLSIARSGKPVKPSQYNHIVSGNLKRFSELTNLMAWLKDLTKKDQERRDTIDYGWIESAAMCLEQFISAHEETEEAEEALRKAKFLLAQLQLLPKHSSSRRYSLESMLSAYTINTYSPKAYEELRSQGILTLPSTITLGRLFRDLKVHTATDQSDDKYLELRLKNGYGDKRKLVSLIHDEIFLRREIQYVGAQGKMHGLTEDCEVAKTALCFMVSSLLSKDRDIVAIYILQDILVARKLSCESGHECAKSIVMRFFNCCAANFAKDTSAIQAAPKCKVLKLTSQ